MMSDEIGFAPFKTVYIHPLITDTKGRKMSKSFGNTETPDTLIDNYDVDSVRLSLFLSIDNSLHRVIVDKSKPSLVAVRTILLLQCNSQTC